MDVDKSTLTLNTAIVILPIFDADYRFIMCNFGTNGRILNGSLLQDEILLFFYEKLQDDYLKISGECTIMSTFRKLPYLFVEDNAFPLGVDTMKPY